MKRLELEEALNKEEIPSVNQFLAAQNTQDRLQYERNDVDCILSKYAYICIYFWFVLNKLYTSKLYTSKIH